MSAQSSQRDSMRRCAMATITSRTAGTAIARKPRDADADWALKRLDLEWRDGGAYALLGPSGCGKTTLLNIISGLLRPTAGPRPVRRARRDRVPTDKRNIAQVFQFPVVYDTMTVFDNLAFPLRNRGMPEPEVDARVHEIAAHARPGGDADAARRRA